MREIQLTRDKVALVDDDDYERVSQHKWWTCQYRNNWYAMTRINGQEISMHRFILNPGELEVDHENMDGLDNRRENLRFATFNQNQRNKKIRGDSGLNYKGVSKASKNRWMARIFVDGKRIYLGSFRSELEAAKAYDVAARKYYREFSRTNF